MTVLYCSPDLYFDNNPHFRKVAEWFRYPSPDALHQLIEDWHNTTYSDDPTISGILADYLTDHRDELLTGATGPSDPAKRLDELIDYLRSRFNSQFGVQQ